VFFLNFLILNLFLVHFRLSFSLSLVFTISLFPQLIQFLLYWAHPKPWFNFGIAADITTPNHDFSSTLLDLSNQFVIKSIKVLIVRDFGNTTYIDV